MKIEIKFDIGDIIYYLKEITSSTLDTCPICNGQKTITKQIYEKNVEFVCTKCWGNDYYTYKPTYTIMNSKVLYVDILYRKAVPEPTIIYYFGSYNTDSVFEKDAFSTKEEVELEYKKRDEKNN